MKHTLTLAAWNFRLARRSLLALWGIFAAQQLALVVFRICWQGAAGMGLASHYYFTMQIFAYPGFYLLTGLAAGLATHNSRRARSGYTWLRCPAPQGKSSGPRPSPSPPPRSSLLPGSLFGTSLNFTPSPRWKSTWPASCTARPCRPLTCTSRSSPTTCFPACCRAVPCSW